MPADYYSSSLGCALGASSTYSALLFYHAKVERKSSPFSNISCGNKVVRMWELNEEKVEVKKNFIRFL